MSFPDTSAKPASPRLLSLDAYRGFIMISLAFSGFGLAGTAALHLREQGPSKFWEAVRYQFGHVEWVGCAFWDLIQPSFMFMVGVALAFSYAKREQQGQTYPAMFRHAVWRSLVLILLGIFLISNGQASTNWSLMNVLTQIGLGYTFLFLLWGRPISLQAAVAAILLIGTWLAYVLYPASGIDLSAGAPDLGVSREWAQQHLAGIAPAWHKNANVGHAVDLWLLNLLPQKTTFTYNGGGYQTINFIPSLATMLFGLMSGELLRSAQSARNRLTILVAAGLGGIIAGQVLNLTGVCPLVKRIWTPSWALFSGGWCCLILASFYAVVDVQGYRRWTFPLLVVGVNSIAIYCMSQLLDRWVAGVWRTHLGADVFLSWGTLNEPTLRCLMIGLVYWLACWWMYRHRIFIRI
jgi:predicted acyltransferase